MGAKDGFTANIEISRRVQHLKEYITMYTRFFKRILDFLATNSPNKLFDSLSAGKPIIVNSPGWTKDLVERYECGVFVGKDIQHSNETLQYFPRYRNNEQFSFGINKKQPNYFKHLHTKE